MKKSFFIIVMLFLGIGLQAQETTDKYKITLNGKEGTTITISKDEILKAGEIRVAPTTAQILSFNLEYTVDGVTKVLSARSRTLTKEMKEAISNMGENATFKFTGIVLGEQKALYSSPEINVTLEN